MWVYLLRRKGDAAWVLEKFLSDTRSDSEVVIIRSDGGTEFQGPFSGSVLEASDSERANPSLFSAIQDLPGKRYRDD